MRRSGDVDGSEEGYNVAALRADAIAEVIFGVATTLEAMGVTVSKFPFSSLTPMLASIKP